MTRRDDWLLHQLPVSMTEDDFFVRFLTIFQNIGDTVLHQIDTLPHQFDPTVAPPIMVRAMAEWLGIDWVDSSLDARLQREIVMRYTELIQWRGTKYGVRKLLELITGGVVVIDDSGGVFAEGEAPGGPALVRIEVESSGFTDADDLVRIVRDELPANVAFRLLVAGDEVWPPPVATGAQPTAYQTIEAQTRETGDA